MMRILVLIAALAATACKTTTMTAPHSIVPVLIGPVQRLGGGTDTRSPDGTFETAGSDFTIASGGPDGSSSSAMSRSAPTQFDWDVLVTTNGREGPAIVVRSFHCVGYSFFAMFAMVAKSRCDIGGDLLPAPRRRRPPPARPTIARGWYCFESQLGSRCTRTKERCEGIVAESKQGSACTPAATAYCLPTQRFGPGNPEGICVPSLATCQASASYIPHEDGTPMTPADCVEVR